MASPSPIRILLVENDADDAARIQKSLEERAGLFSFRLDHVETLVAGLAQIDEGGLDIILLELLLPEGGGLDAVTTLWTRAPQIPIVVLTDLKDEEVGKEAVGLGAQDYLIKGSFDSQLLIRSILYAIERAQLQAHLDVMRDEFIGTVSHELRTPLTIIKTAVSNLKDGVVGGLNARQIKVVETAERNIARLSRLIRELLDLSRLRSGRARMNLRRLKPVSLLHETVEGFRQAAGQGHITLTTDIDPDLPAVYADVDMVTQVVTNLINNALRFAKERVIVRGRVVESPQTAIQVSVIDDGQGIPKEKMGGLFKKFVQLERTEGGGHYQGTGLGLAICKEIIEDHRGKIWAESVPGQGAQFHFTLPPYEEQAAFRLALEEAVAQANRQASPMALLSVTLQNAAAIQKECGEKAFENLLRELDEGIRNQVLRKGDTLFHYSEDRLMIIVLESDESGGRSVGARVEKVAKGIHVAGKKGPMEPLLEIGVAVCPENGETAEALIASVEEG